MNSRLDRIITMKLAFTNTQTDPETVFNTLRLALNSLKQGDKVDIFISGRGVEIDAIHDVTFDVKAVAHDILDAGGRFLACWNLSETTRTGWFGNLSALHAQGAL